MSGVKPQSESKEDTLKGWTTEDKFKLLQAAKKVGLLNLDKLKNLMQNKTEHELKIAVDFYLKQAQEEPPKVPKRQRSMCTQTAPMTRWANLMIDTHGYEAIQTETSMALRMIADLEDIPPPELTENIDFRKIYRTLADTMEGKPLPNDDQIWTIFAKCTVDTAYTCVAFSKRTGWRDALKPACHPEMADVNPSTNSTENDELSTLQYLIATKNYNPLNIYEEHLACSKPEHELKIFDNVVNISDSDSDNIDNADTVNH